MLAAIKMKHSLIPLLFFFSNVTAQNVMIREIRLKPKSEFFKTSEKTIIYPIISTNNSRIDNIINKQIKEGSLNLETEKQSAINALNDQIVNGLINLSYEVTYKKNGILSLNIYMEGCVAHCSSWTTYFNFDIKTGKLLGLSDLMIDNKIDSFKNIVFSDKIKALKEYKIEEVNNLKNNHIDSTSYNWILDEVDNGCMKDINIEDFSISSLGIKIFDLCEFPFAIRSQEPSYELKYSFKFIYPYLRQKFKTVFQK